MGWNRDDDYRAAEQARQAQIRADEERADARRREQDERDRLQRAADAARRAQEALQEQKRQDELIARAARDYADQVARDRQAALQASATQHKADLQGRADQLNQDLWKRAERESAAQHVAFDEIIRKRSEYHHARAIAEQEIARRRVAAGSRVRVDPFADMADAGVAMLHGLFFGHGSSLQPSFNLSDLSDSDLEMAVRHFDFGPSDMAGQRMDGAEMRRLAEQKAMKDEEAERIRREKEKQMELEAKEGRELGLHERWNWRLKLKVADVKQWQQVLLAFPGVEWSRSDDPAEKWLDGWSSEFRLGAEGAMPEMMKVCPQAWSDFLDGFKQSTLFREDGSLNDDVQRVLEGTDGASFGDPAMPSIRVKGGPELVDVIALLRSGDLIEFNLKHPAPDEPLSSNELWEKERDGSLYQYTFDRCQEMADVAKSSPRVNGRVLGAIIRMSITDPLVDIEDLPMPGHSLHSFRRP